MRFAQAAAWLSVLFLGIILGSVATRIYDYAKWPELATGEMWPASEQTP